MSNNGGGGDDSPRRPAKAPGAGGLCPLRDGGDGASKPRAAGRRSLVVRETPEVGRNPFPAKICRDGDCSRWVSPGLGGDASPTRERPEEGGALEPGGAMGPRSCARILGGLEESGSLVASPRERSPRPAAGYCDKEAPPRAVPILGGERPWMLLPHEGSWESPRRRRRFPYNYDEVRDGVAKPLCGSSPRRGADARAPGTSQEAFPGFLLRVSPATSPYVKPTATGTLKFSAPDAGFHKATPKMEADGVDCQPPAPAEVREKGPGSSGSPSAAAPEPNHPPPPHVEPVPHYHAPGGQDIANVGMAERIRIGLLETRSILDAGFADRWLEQQERTSTQTYFERICNKLQLQETIHRF